MKQLVILSGKGGTGKTSITAAFAHLAQERVPVKMVLTDADVDAANLELVLKPDVLEEQEFIGSSVANINADMCSGCGICQGVCRFDAIFMRDYVQAITQRSKRVYYVDDMACEGCAACFYQCPSKAIRMEPQVEGRWFRSHSRYGPLLHAALRPAKENSGKLVTLIKQQANAYGQRDPTYRLLLVDGPPGIGCPVIAASSGADLALIVTEPTASGIHDLERIVQTTKHFRLPTLVCINKADIYEEGVRQLTDYCQQQAIEVVGHIPFDANITQAMTQGEPVTAWQPDAPVSHAIEGVWRKVLQHLELG